MTTDPQVVLQSVAGESKQTEAVFRALAGMGKARPTTDLNRLRLRVRDTQKLSLTSREIEAIFVRLEEEGIGKLVVSQGARHTPTFVWKKLNNVQAGQMALKRARPTPTTYTAPIERQPASAVGSELITAYPVRPGYTARIKLPADVSATELQALADFIRSLV